MNSSRGGDSEQIVTIMAVMTDVIYCADETGENYCVERSDVHAGGVLVPTIGQRLIVTFKSSNGESGLSVRLPS